MLGFLGWVVVRGVRLFGGVPGMGFGWLVVLPRCSLGVVTAGIVL